jgi:L-serine dehydratase
MFKSVEELVRTATERGIPISEVMIEQEVHVRRSTREEVVGMMERNLEVMEEAVARALEGVTSS